MNSLPVRFLTNSTAALFILCAQSVNAAQQQDPVTLKSSDGNTLGYVHVFTPDNPDSNANIPIEPIVYLPGFDINLADIIENESSSSVGSRTNALKTIRELVLTQSPNPASQHPQLLEQLVDEYGHTLVLLEYADDQAGIEHNALAVEALLTDSTLPVMQSYQSTGTRSLLLGWSMGGMIGRYALTKMEHEGIDHYIDLYISYDVPHKGANLPLALEAVAGLTKEVLEDSSSSNSLTQFENLLEAAQTQYNSLSAREMLKPHLGIPPNASVLNTLQTRYDQIYQSPETEAASGDFYSIRNKLLLQGQYPERTRKVAISNGNLLGTPLPLPLPRNGNELVRLTARVPITSRFSIRVMDLRLYDDSSVNARSNCQIYYLFETTNCPPLQMPTQLHKLSAGVGSHTNVIEKLATVFENQESLKGEWLNQGYSVEFEGQVRSGEGLTTFIPMSSAFDFLSAETEPNGVTADQTPFDSIYANDSENLAHNAVAPKIVNALVGEIADRRQERIETQSIVANY